MDKKAERWRNEGAGFALRIAKERGVEGLEKELRMRGALNISVVVPGKDMREMYQNMATRVMNTMKTVVLWTLYNEYGWKKVRLQRFIDQVDKYSNQLMTLDQYGNAHVTFLDMAAELEEIGIKSDMESLEKLEELQKSERDKLIRFDLVLDALEKCDLDDVAEELRQQVASGRMG